ncbi:MAG TPA: MFS transporter, partial [Kofleriaceae bacterium]|nr:MFS transporter [Kofleriaceae bacterium]
MTAPTSDRAADPRRRVIAQLFAAAAAGSTSFYAFFTVAPLLALELTGSRAWSGLPGTCTVLGAAVGTALLSIAMTRAGRRAGLAAGFALGVCGGVLAIASAMRERFTFLLGGAALLGVAHAATSLARFAAADVVVPARRGLVLGTVLWASTIGALLGPALPRLGASLEAVGLDPRAGALVLVAAGYAVAAVLTAALRPDPSSLMIQVEAPSAAAGADALDWRAPDVVLALVALVVGQLAMISVMVVTPVHVHEGGHGVGAVGVVMATHFAGMFALAPLVGWLVPRAGAAAVIVAGMVI